MAGVMINVLRQDAAVSLSSPLLERKRFCHAVFCDMGPRCRNATGKQLTSPGRKLVAEFAKTSAPLCVVVTPRLYMEPRH